MAAAQTLPAGRLREGHCEKSIRAEKPARALQDPMGNPSDRTSTTEEDGDKIAVLLFGATGLIGISRNTVLRQGKPQAQNRDKGLGQYLHHLLVP